jgi:hypothetical protein
MPLPPWISDQLHKDNWLTVARLRAQTEAAYLPDTVAQTDAGAQTIASLLDDHHEF